MEATETRCGAGCVLQMKLQRARSRASELRPFSGGFDQMPVEKGDHTRVQELTKGTWQPSKPLALTAPLRPKSFQPVCGLRDHAPMNPAERTMPFRATTSSRMRSARVETCASAALAMFSFSITGSRV